MDKPHALADTAGLLVSSLCLVHCLAMPLVLAALPALAHGAGPGVHLVLFGAALLAALAALAPGYLAHRAALAPLLGGAGLALLGAGVFVVGPRLGHAAETWCSVAGALLLGAGHVRNRRRCRRRDGGCGAC